MLYRASGRIDRGTDEGYPCRYGGKGMTQILQNLSEMISQNGWLAPVLALFAGVLTSFTPCSLSSVPLVIGFVGGTGQRNTKKAFRLSVTFALGTAVTFTVLGVSASLAGHLIGNAASWWYIILGVLMLLMALQTWGIYEIIPSSYLISKNTKKGYFGAFIAGILGGVFPRHALLPCLLHCLLLLPEKEVFLGDIIIAALFYWTRYTCHCCRNINRICAKAVFQ